MAVMLWLQCPFAVPRGPRIMTQNANGDVRILNMIKSWSGEWLLRLNIDKCKCVSYCIKHPTDTGYYIMDRNQLFPLDKVESMVDHGVRFDNNLTFRDHISEKN